MFVVDTNVLMDFPKIIEENDALVILTDVLKELDGLKMNPNPETSYKARRAAVVISHNLDRLAWDYSLEKEKMPVDDKLLAVAAAKDDVLITNDVYLKVKATIRGIKTHGYGGGSPYNGMKIIMITPDENKQHKLVNQIFSSGGAIPEELQPLYESQYVIFKDETDPYTNKHGEVDYSVFAIFVVEEGRLRQISDSYSMRIKNTWTTDKGIGPRNPEQTCLFDALNNRSKTIVYAGGAFGTGKSFLLNNFAIQELERGAINKIVYVPNNAYTADTIELGALPGELLEKTTGQIGPLIDLVGIDQVQQWLQVEQLEIVPMSFIRGRSFNNCIIIVNEAQNLTEDHIKLLVARCGEGTRILFDGDQKQIDSQTFRNKNGLQLLLELHRSPIYSKMFAAVKLNLTERSKTAQASAYLDNLTGGI